MSEVPDRLRRLLENILEIPAESIDNDFVLSPKRPMDPDHFLKILAAALNRDFEIDATADSIRDIKTFEEMVSFIQSFNLATNVLLQKTTLAFLHK